MSRKTPGISCFLKPLAVEFQGPAIFGDHPDNMIRHTVGCLGLDLRRKGDLSAESANPVGDDVVSKASSITAYSGWSQIDVTVETFSLCCFCDPRIDGC